MRHCAKWGRSTVKRNNRMNSTTDNLDLFRFSIRQENLDNTDITFKISLGDREFTAYITQWSNSFASICEDIEALLFEDHSGIELDDDTEPTVLSIRCDGEILSVNIEPSHFLHLAPVCGKCSRKDFIRELYDGLLFATTFCYDEVGCGWNWDNCKMVCYNMMKSGTIEEYIRTSSARRSDNFATRHILVFDGNEMLHVCDETVGYRIPVSEVMLIKGRDGSVITEIDGALLKSGQFRNLAEALPDGFDFWTVRKEEDGYLHPHLYVRESCSSNEIFLKEKCTYKELGEDPYGFTAETLWHACNELDLDRIKHFLSLGADTTFIFKWVLSADGRSETDRLKNPRYKPSEAELRGLDDEKARIIDYVIRNCPECEVILKRSQEHTRI